MTTSGFRRTILAVAFCVCLAGCHEERDLGFPPLESEPNFLFLVIDALRPDHIGYLGYRQDTTPTLDDLASRGITFTDNTSPSSYTRASVPSIFTSVFPSAHGVLTQSKKVEVLSDSFTTLAELLAAHGYATAAFMPNPSLRKMFDFGQGFDLYDDDLLFRGPDRSRRSKFETAIKIHRRGVKSEYPHGPFALVEYTKAGKTKIQYVIDNTVTPLKEDDPTVEDLIERERKRLKEGAGKK